MFTNYATLQITQKKEIVHLTIWTIAAKIIQAYRHEKKKTNTSKYNQSSNFEHSEILNSFTVQMFKKRKQIRIQITSQFKQISRAKHFTHVF